MTESNSDHLLEAAATAWRPRSVTGEIRFHPAWHDLDETRREEVYALAFALRTLEASVDPAGLSTTARAVLARIRAPR